MEEFQWFLMALSVLPMRNYVISAHLLPLRRWHKNSSHSSSSHQDSLLIRGFKWLCQRSLHCFPILPGICCAMNVHFYGPCSSTSLITNRSSSSLQGILRALFLVLLLLLSISSSPSYYYYSSNCIFSRSVGWSISDYACSYAWNNSFFLWSSYSNVWRLLVSVYSLLHA